MSTYNDWRDGLQSQLEELNLTDLPAQGNIPHWLSGAFISTGPGNFEIPCKSNIHWFDGYAMLKAFYIHGGKVSFKNKLLLSDTYLWDNYVIQPQKQLPIEHQQFDYIKQRTTELNPDNYQYDNGNVNVCSIYGQAIAMTELPSKVTFDINTLTTTGHLQYQSDFSAQSELAHTTFDPTGQQWINVACIFGEKTEYLFYRFNQDNKQKEVLARYQSDIPFYIHSFAVTEAYFILFQTPLIWDFSDPNAEFCDMLHYSDDLPSQFIIINRQNQQTTIIPTSPFICFHQANAYEENKQLIIDCNSPRHPERSEGSPCSGTISSIKIDINRPTQDSMY